jgi:hypothetical protein
MLLVLEDDDCIHVYPSPEAASLNIEALDADDTIRAAFDETGVPYRILWLRPNKSRRLLGPLSWVENGKYSLVPAGAPDRAALAALIRPNRQVIPAEASAVIARLRTAG